MTMDIGIQTVRLAGKITKLFLIAFMEMTTAGRVKCAIRSGLL